MDDNPWTGLMIICLVVIAIIVICCSPASAAECRLVGKPEPKPWEPDLEDVAYICAKGQITFLRGRLKFGGSDNSAPFPSMIVVFDRRYQFGLPELGT